MTLQEIERATKLYADARADLASVVTELNDQIEAAKRKHLAEIKRLVARAADRHGALSAALQDGKDLFNKPRTATFHGIKVGFMKGKGGIAFDDADTVVARIHKLYDDAEAKTLLHITEKPDKEALENLPADQLKKLGCTVVNTDDQVVIKPADSEVDKVVKALLAAATEIEQVDAA